MKLHRHFAIACLLVIVASASFAQANHPRPPAEPYEQEEAYAVYSAVIPTHTRHTLHKLPPHIVILGTTSAVLDMELQSNSVAPCFPEAYRAEFNDAFADFAMVNNRSWRLLRQFRLPRDYDFVSEHQLQAMSKLIPQRRREIEETPPPTLEQVIRPSKSPVTQLEDHRVFLWDEYYKVFPESGGYYILSAVGFNSKHDKAVVRVSLLCGGLCALSTDYLLKKQHGVWTILSVQSTCGFAS